MQLLDSHSIQRSHLASERLQQALQDIVCNLQIKSSLCIQHPDYKPLEVPEEAVSRFQHLPSELQKKYLNVQLRSFLYGIYYNGFLREMLSLEADEDPKAVQKDFENNTFLGVDVAFYERLHENNRGEGYFDPGWNVLRHEEDGSVVVHQHGLTLHLDREKHLQPETIAAVGETVAIRLPRNLVQNGFYMAVGNAGAGKGKNIARIYFNLSPDGAVAVMDSLTREVNEMALPFSFKALYNPSDYQRYDSAVLYFERSQYPKVRSILQKVYEAHRAEFRELVPLFTKVLAPGLAIAEEPDFNLSESESFGTNRCQIVANALLEAWHQGQDAPDERMTAIERHFSNLKIDLERPYLNATSEDLYAPLEL